MWNTPNKTETVSFLRGREQVVPLGQQSLRTCTYPDKGHIHEAVERVTERTIAAFLAHLFHLVRSSAAPGVPQFGCPQSIAFPPRFRRRSAASL